MSVNNMGKRPKLTREGVGGQFLYFLDRSFANIRQNLLVNILSVITIALAILIVSFFLLGYVNLQRVTERWSERVQVTAYFDSEPAAADLAQLRKRVESLGGSEKITYVSKREALRRFQARLKGQDALLEGVSADILPASLEIRLKSEARGSEALTSYVARLKRIPGISEVQYGEEWVKSFNNFMDFMRIAGILSGSFLVLAVIFIVANTIKLTIYSRKEEIELLALVGATRMFIKAPFLIEGIIQGAVGAIVALAILSGVYLGVLRNAGDLIILNPLEAELVFLPLSHLAAILLGGILLGFLGSLTSLKRFITV